MRLQDVIRADKNIESPGQWKTGVKMPKALFPLGGDFRVRRVHMAIDAF